MKTRAWRTPLSIWIIVVVLAAITVQPLFRLIGGGPYMITPVWLGLWAVAFAVMAYHAVALIRLSRWPIVLVAALLVASFLVRIVSGKFDPRQMSLLGLLLMWLPLCVYLACTLPHWRKMNWAFFGRPYRPHAHLEETFA
jgi:hypothetical protein